MIHRLRAHLKVIDEKKLIKPRPNKKAGVISNKLFMVCPLFLIFLLIQQNMLSLIHRLLLIDQKGMNSRAYEGKEVSKAITLMLCSEESG